MPSGITGNFVQVEAALAALIPRVEAADEVAQQAGAELVAADAARRAPRLTGHMAASVDEDGGSVVVDTPYAVYQEYGTRRHAAQPFLGPASDAMGFIWRQEAEKIYTVATR